MARAARRKGPSRSLKLPRFYPIVDAGLLAARGIEVRRFAEELRDAGVSLLQYRDKSGEPSQILCHARIIDDVFRDIDRLLVMNDDPVLAMLSDWNAVHVGQEDTAVMKARKMLLPGGIVGCSTHNDEQVRAAVEQGADYIAIGPVFQTSTKENPDPVVGLEGVRRARALTKLPLVAIGGITLENAPSVIEAGADSVAVISALLVDGSRVEKVAEDFLRVLG
ncbi:MAG TPA: thiamine phosphate synthase [Edaphobacter sp.]